MTIPNVEGVADVINKALVESGVMKNEVGYISAHGTGTKMNDKVECSALRKIFDSNLASIPVSSIKSMLGHAMGAASSLEAISCSLALHTGDLPPTINYNTPDEDCLIDCVPNISRKRQLNIALNNAFAFGGNNACLVLRSVRKA
jgi:3-oxoacyl-[acyl-carrier-protein] synthase II